MAFAAKLDVGYHFAHDLVGGLVEVVPFWPRCHQRCQIVAETLIL